jgi:hypothetical protein
MFQVVLLYLITLLNTNYLHQRMHYLLKRKILQFVFKYFFYIAPTCFGPIGPSLESTYQNVAKVTKITVSLKYQLKHFVKIVLAWRMKGSGGVVGRGCVGACPTPPPTPCTQHTPNLPCATPQLF